jgi:DNA polymerase-1
VENLVVTGDKDLLQLVTELTHVFIPKRGRYGKDIEYNRETVEQRMGVRPERVIDLKALMGDSSDNIPGVYGVGEKTALKLLEVFDSVEDIYAGVDWIEGQQEALPTDVSETEAEDLLSGAVLTRLQKGREDAFMSKELVTIRTDAPIELDLEACRLNGYDKREAEELFAVLEFETLVEMLPPDDFEIGVEDALL